MLEQLTSMSTFARFLKELSFLPEHFRRQESPRDSVTQIRPDLAGITINVYELEIQDEDDHRARARDVESEGGTSPTLTDDENEDPTAVSASTSGAATVSSHQVRYANIVVFCRKCKSEVPVCTLEYHRRRHRALETLRYMTECPPVTVRGLLRRRNKAMSDVMKRSFSEEGQLMRNILKINVAYELLKNELEGTSAVDHGVLNTRWRERDIRSEGKILNGKMALGVTKYKKQDSSSPISKCVCVENFLEEQEGIFLGIYQGYHGNYVTQLCVRELHRDIQKNLQEVWNMGCSVDDVKSAFQDAYKRIDRVQLTAEGENPWTRWSGCSAVTCFLVGDKLYVANEGVLRGLLIRDNNTIRAVTSRHDLYNRRERMRVRRRQGVVVKTEKCALVNGVLATTRGIGNQGDWRLKVCVINKPAFGAVSLKEGDRMLVLATEGLWKVFDHREILFVLDKFIRDAVTLKSKSEMEVDVHATKVNATEEMSSLSVPKATKHDSEFRAFARKVSVTPIDFSVPENVKWNPNNPRIFIRRPTVISEEPAFLEASPANEGHRSHVNVTEQDDEDLQELARIVRGECESVHARREISRLLSKRLLKSALIAGAEVDNIVMVLLLRGFKKRRVPAESHLI